MHSTENNESAELFQDAVDKRIEEWLGVIQYKAVHPTYILLNSRDENGYIKVFEVGHPEFSKSRWNAYQKAGNLGLIDRFGYITKDGLEWLSAPIEL